MATTAASGSAGEAAVGENVAQEADRLNKALASGIQVRANLGFQLPTERGLVDDKLDTLSIRKFLTMKSSYTRHPLTHARTHAHSWRATSHNKRASSKISYKCKNRSRDRVWRGPIIGLNLFMLRRIVS